HDQQHERQRRREEKAIAKHEAVILANPPSYRETFRFRQSPIITRSRPRHHRKALSLRRLPHADTLRRDYESRAAPRAAKVRSRQGHEAGAHVLATVRREVPAVAR